MDFGPSAMFSSFRGSGACGDFYPQPKKSSEIEEAQRCSLAEDEFDKHVQKAKKIVGRRDDLWITARVIQFYQLTQIAVDSRIFVTRAPRNRRNCELLESQC
jgi:hypothetical protein